MTAGAPEVRAFASVRFRRERENGWLELEALVEQVREHGTGSLEPDQLERFPLLYRSALSSLSVARAIALDRALIDYLDNLTLRAFLAFYAPPLDVAAAAQHFFVRGLPQAVRALRWHVLIALAALAIGILTGFVLVNGNEQQWFGALVPADLAGGRGPASSAADLMANEIAAPVPDNVFGAIANGFFSNNTLVALLIFGTGMLAGVPTILLTAYNGTVLGAMFALHYHRGLTVEFAGWVGIHGVTELLAVVLMAAAGLRLGEILIFPTESSRADAFAIHGPAAAKVAVGGVAMLAVAAVLEGYFRPAVQSTDARLAVAVAGLLAWAAYFTFAGRNASE
ncbi:MAG TPA: stage II sporulation protein M [Candidatus Elarobacter sp.]|jgi:uncharacterized membrane protein SpoIIM required for sporulation|nr:stage II sporulation protein M [Candidatus Elarobacter sp.]